MTVRVVTAAQAAARDAAAIAAGIPSWELMSRAGAAAASLVLRDFGARLPGGVAVFAGPGNNGGDAWVVARRLAAAGAVVRVCELGDVRSDDARRARGEALPHVSLGIPEGNEAVVIDGLLGTGARGDPQGAIGDAVDRIGEMRSHGAIIVALDVPSGLDASTGSAGRAVQADLTITFGTIKRGHLVARGRVGGIAVVDIGLGPFADLDDGAPRLVDEAWVAANVPSIVAEAHKGVRRRLAIVGGARGMAGATVLAARAATRSGIGMVRLVVGEESLAPVQSSVTEATAVTWPLSPADLEMSVARYAHGILAGPGLGVTPESKQHLEDLLHVWRGPLVLDADALNLFAGRVADLGRLLDRRAALLTPHAGELARLLETEADDVVDRRFEVGRDLARSLNAVVLLKGVPTVIWAPNGDTLVNAAGTPVLAAAGSGDLLGGIAATLLAQTGDPFASAAIAAWVHGRAAELANHGRPVRGVTLDDVLAALPNVWRFAGARPQPPVLLELPRIGDVV